jgi:hypothetical protein
VWEFLDLFGKFIVQIERQIGPNESQTMLLKECSDILWKSDLFRKFLRFLGGCRRKTSNNQHGYAENA